MSNQAPQPPSIAPKRPPGSAGGQGGVRTTEDGTRSASGVATGAGSGSEGSADGPSMTDRLKKAAGSAAGAARNALPTKTDEPSSAKRTDERPGERSQQGQQGPTTSPVTTSPAPSNGPRRVRLAVARVDPWSIMKLSFLLSVAVGIMIVVATAVVWYTLDGMAVFTRVNDVIATLASDPTFFDLEEYAAFDRVISLATMVAVVDIVLLTALATIGAFLYNITAALVGGINLTLTDD